MGSGQSRTLNNEAEKSSPTASRSTENVSSSLDVPQSINAKGAAKQNINESGPARAQRICRKKKRAYDACYTAQLSSKEEDCNDLFDQYRSCFLRVMTRDMEKRGVKVSENSMIGEYKEDTAEDE